jgi:hypothetical protein
VTQRATNCRKHVHHEAYTKSRAYLTIASGDDGIVIPSALAVLRLRTSPVFETRRTGRSKGFSPFNIRPAKFQRDLPDFEAQAGDPIKTLPSIISCVVEAEPIRARRHRFLVNSLDLDAGILDDWPPFLDFRLLIGA